MSEENKAEIIAGYGTIVEPSLADQINALVHKEIKEYLDQVNVHGGIINLFIEKEAHRKAQAIKDELFKLLHNDTVEDKPILTNDEEIALLKIPFNLSNVKDIKKGLMLILLSELAIDDRILSAWIRDDLIPDELKATILEPLLGSL
jgi:hypothetical protein